MVYPCLDLTAVPEVNRDEGEGSTIEGTLVADTTIADTKLVGECRAELRVQLRHQRIGDATLEVPRIVELHTRRAVAEVVRLVINVAIAQGQVVCLVDVPVQTKQSLESFAGDATRGISSGIIAKRLQLSRYLVGFFLSDLAVIFPWDVGRRNYLLDIFSISEEERA